MRTVSVLLLLALARPTQGQEAPLLTEARHKTVNAWVERCRKAGAFSFEGKGEHAVLRWTRRSCAPSRRRSANRSRRN